MIDTNTTLKPEDRLVLQSLVALRNELLKLDAELANDEELLIGTLDGETPVLDQLREVVRAALLAGEQADAIKAREYRMKARRSRLERREERCRAFVLEALQTLRIKRLDAADFAAALRQGKPPLEITDLEALPQGFVRIKREPDKETIRSALTLGQKVPGAMLGNPSPYLIVTQD